MRASIIKIGNSQGVRIPKPLLDQTGIKDDVELEVEKSQIIIRPISSPRAGWDNAFKSMSQNNDDDLLDGNEVISHSWDEQEWQWK
jgi:antitoxin MazE